MGFAGFTTTFPLFLDDPLGLNPMHAGAMFALVGTISAIAQGGAIGPLVERYGEKLVGTVGGLLLGAALAVMGLARTTPITVAMLVPVGLGWGMMAPSIQSLISRRAHAHEQGEVLGVNQSSSAMARMIGPVAAGAAFGVFGPGLGFLAGGLLVLAAAAWIWLMPPRGAAVGDPNSAAVDHSPAGKAS
jgi:DHA1 family tetracycline resistance protein-like MFS transporter